MMPYIPADVAEAMDALEKDLALALGLFAELAASLRASLGEQALGPRLTAIAKAGDADSLEAFVSRVEALVQGSDEGASARQLREFVGLTWDEAYALRQRWRGLSLHEKRGLGRRLAFRRAAQVQAFESGTM